MHMAVNGLDHVNLRVADVLETMRFYENAFGLTATGMVDPHPSAQGGWLRDESGRPIIHVGSLASTYPGDDGLPVMVAHGSGAIHHLAINCTGWVGFVERFAALGLEWRENELPEIPLRQLFVIDPNGVMVELNFFG